MRDHVSERTPIAVLISGRGSNLGSLIEAARAPDYPAKIALVLSDNPAAGGLAVARDAGIVAAAISRKAFESRDAFEYALGETLDAAGVDLVCLAGFMRILSGPFVAKWQGRMLNIHPSLLPAFKGLNTHQRAIEAGVKLHGATVHLVTKDLDDGPILAQAAIPVLAGEDSGKLASRVLAVEHKLYPAALARFLRAEAGAGTPPETALFNPPVPASS